MRQHKISIADAQLLLKKWEEEKSQIVAFGAAAQGKELVFQLTGIVLWNDTDKFSISPSGTETESWVICNLTEAAAIDYAESKDIPEEFKAKGLVFTSGITLTYSGIEVTLFAKEQ